MTNRPKDFGLYEASREHDACGIGAVVNISGVKNHDILRNARQIIENLQHRGAAGSDESTGDGGGVLFQIPHDFFLAECKKRKTYLPEAREYGVGMVFLPKKRSLAKQAREIMEKQVAANGLGLLGWRQVPVNTECLGDIAKEGEPLVRQFFVHGNGLTDMELERQLFMLRKHISCELQELGDVMEDAYVCSLSCRTVCYKGMFLAPQLYKYYPDLSDERVVSALAIVHQRYSTNTFPSWRLAQPFRMCAHNGEINTLRGNLNRIAAAEPAMATPELGDLSKLGMLLAPGQSDSACFDNVAELLTMAGRTLPHSIMMMMPEAFGTRYHISTDKRSFYEYHASIMQPWDGPAAMVFTDGNILGGTLDRNGLRPCRYVVTKDDLVVMASETGVIDFPPDRIQAKGRLQPGKMFLIDTVEGRMITDNEIKSRISRQQPYRRWLEQNRVELKSGYVSEKSAPVDPETLMPKLRMFGYTREDLYVLLEPMGKNGQEPIGSMGNDVPLAVLSDKPKHVFEYFKQMFAQVTNPPIDPLREGLVMSLMNFGGKSRNLLVESPEHCRQLKLPHPILTNSDLKRLRSEPIDGFTIATIDATFDGRPVNPGRELREALEELIADAEAAIRNGASMLIISDRNADKDRAPIPSLLATGAVHHGLLRKGLRGEVDLIIESGEVREVQHYCLLVGYGAFAVNPYIAFDALEYLHQTNCFPKEWKHSQVVDHYINAIKKGILKTMSKMGISTLRSYLGAQLFECIGLDKDVINLCFSGTSSRISGAGFDELAKETMERYRHVYRDLEPGQMDLEYGGEYSFRADGERHGWSPEAIYLMQHAVRGNDEESWRRFSEIIDDQSRELKTLRGLFKFKTVKKPVSLDKVEPAEEILKRFCTGAMSQGSISREAHEAMAAGMNAVGGMNNTGEGGEDPRRYEGPIDGWDLNSKIKQVASGRFGVTINYLAHAKELQIKMAQGAKPGEGGQLPGHKVTREIAKLRHSTPGVSLISPPPHHDIYSIEDLAQLIYDLKCSNPGVKVSVKLVSEVGVGTIAAGVAKGNADEVLVSGHDGGTGASPLSSLKHAGCPWELGLAETQQTLVLNGLRDRIRVQADGQMRTGRDIAIAALLGAEQYGFGTGALVSLGCIMMRKCHQGTCPVGVATQDKALRKLFTGKPEHLMNFMRFIAEDVRKIMGQLGFKTLNDMIGRVDLLEMSDAIEHYKGKNLDLSPIFAIPDKSKGHSLRRLRDQRSPLDDHMDWTILKKLGAKVKSGTKASLDLKISNTDRTAGTILSNKIVLQHGAKGLPTDTFTLNFKGSAGQSFGAFLAPGITLRLEGDANDYVGKGLSGGRIVIVTPPEADFVQYENIIAGNTLLYGATSGDVFINGLVGERFAVRNSGATAVVEGVGDHGCEYMTGGTVVVLGRTGRNFAAGMSGGVAYVFDEYQLFDTCCNLDMVDLETVWMKKDVDFLKSLIEKHVALTNSRHAKYILEKWRHLVGCFVKVMPVDYKRSLERILENETRETEATPLTEEVFD